MSDEPSEGIKRQTPDQDHSNPKLPVPTQGIEAASDKNNATEETEPSAEEVNHALKLLGLWTWARFIGHVWLVIKSSSFWMAVATIAIAGFTWKLTDYSSRQWNVMQGQLTIMRAGQRPWVGIGGPIVSTQPSFQYYPAAQNDVTLAMDVQYTLKNFGTAPAFYANGAAILAIKSDTITKPATEMILACLGTDARTKERQGSVIFPADQITNPSGGATSFQSKDISDVRRVWVVACITYEDADHGPHHTKIWARSAFPANVAPIQAIPGKVRYMPITGFEIVGVEAD